MVVRQHTIIGNSQTIDMEAVKLEIFSDYV